VRGDRHGIFSPGPFGVDGDLRDARHGWEKKFDPWPYGLMGKSVGMGTLD